MLVVVVPAFAAKRSTHICARLKSSGRLKEAPSWQLEVQESDG